MDRDHRFPKTWKEARRKRAFELKQQGWKQKDIAEAFAVSPAAVSQWLAKAREDGGAEWRAQPRPTGPIKLTEAQLHVIPELLSHGAEAYGFRGEMWTCARVAAVLWEEFGVSYHKAQISRLLKRLYCEVSVTRLYGFERFILQSGHVRVTFLKEHQYESSIR